MEFKSELLYGAFIKHYGEFFDKESKKLFDSEYMQRTKDKFLHLSHRDRYFTLKLVYTLCGYYELENECAGHFRHIIPVLQVVSSVFIGIIWLDYEDIINIMKLEYDHRMYDRNYNYYIKLSTDKLKHN